MLRNLVRLVTGYERDPELVRQAEEFTAQIEAETKAQEAATAHYPPIPEWGRDFPDSSKPYDGWPVPEGALLQSIAEFLDSFDETWNVAPADNSTNVVEDFRRDVEGRGPNAWLANVIAIHKRLDEGQLCKPHRIFNFMHPSGNLDTVLALHQRWALQYVHSKGIALNGPPVYQTLEYGSVGEALGNMRAVLERCERVLVDGEEDEIDGFEWEREFKYDGNSGQILRVLYEKIQSA
ncbi:hypothetical protein MBLNU13_g04063t1 [Cladosporium sp. NU13]